MALQFGVLDHIEPIPGLDLEHIVWLLRLGAICTRAKLKLRIQPTQMAEFDLRHVEPTAMFGHVVDVEFIGDSFCLRRIKSFIQRSFGVGIEIVHNSADFLRMGIMLVNESLDKVGPIHFGALISSLGIALTCSWLKS